MTAPELIVPEWHLEISSGKGDAGTDAVEVVGPAFRRKACDAAASSWNDGWNPTDYTSYECALFRAPHGFEVRLVSHTVGEYGHHTERATAHTVQTPSAPAAAGLLHRVERVCDGTPEFSWSLPTHPPRFEADGEQLFLVVDFRRLALPVLTPRATSLFGSDSLFWVSVETTDGATSWLNARRPLDAFEPGSEPPKSVRDAGEVARWHR